ncbi:unnamed protein product [Sphenostylis stenocarpa]|uniref:Disease resistance N-terminal domain-containing protein n=1 Tax=Sphenostylis stenocarpa TaxID=92480 RepID=A0AA86VWP7_9FABA|nr:unnamed protein product [Sphenostylis stenocarpa]
MQVNKCQWCEKQEKKQDQHFPGFLCREWGNAEKDNEQVQGGTCIYPKLQGSLNEQRWYGHGMKWGETGWDGSDNMAEFVLEKVIGNLSSLVRKELGLFLGFDQDLERLASLFTAIKATLEEAEEKQFSNKAIKDWLEKLKDADILDDIIDECAYEALRLEYQGVVKCGLSDKVRSSCLSSFHPKYVVFRYKITMKMETISERLKQIAVERTNFHLTGRVPERRSGVLEWRQTTSLIPEPQVYGRKEDTDRIVNFLIDDASHFVDLSVYPIIGLGGLGKQHLPNSSSTMRG